MHLKFGISRDLTEKSLNCSSCIPTHHPSWFLTRCHEAHVCILRYYFVHLCLWWSLLATEAVQQYSIHQNTMQLQDAVLTCNQKLTWVSLSYCMEPLMKKMKVKNKNTTIRTYALHIFYLLHSVHFILLSGMAVIRPVKVPFWQSWKYHFQQLKCAYCGLNILQRMLHFKSAFITLNSLCWLLLQTFLLILA